MLIIGSHVNFNPEQLLTAVHQAKNYGANAFMFYTGSPENTIRHNINSEFTEMAHRAMKDNNISIENIICHAPYIINLANKVDPRKWHFSISFLKQELERCKLLGIKKIVLHPGSAVGMTKSDGIKNIIDALNQVITEDIEILVILETMAGKGTEVGSKSEEMAEIINGLNYPEKIGVCLDTCHLNDAGYSMNDFDTYLEEFDRLIGIDKIKCFHINDSKNELASHKDRHENIGLGTIGFDNLMSVIYHEKLKDVPKILETPYIDRTYSPYKHEIDMIKNKAFNPNLIEDIKTSYKNF